jgi:hypothetical protein
MGSIRWPKLALWLQVEEKLGEHVPEHVLTKQTELITDDLGAQVRFAATVVRMQSCRRRIFT